MFQDDFRGCNDLQRLCTGRLFLSRLHDGENDFHLDVGGCRGTGGLVWDVNSLITNALLSMLWGCAGFCATSVRDLPAVLLFGLIFASSRLAIWA